MPPSYGRGITSCLLYSRTNITFVREAATICPRPLQVDIWPSDLESGVRVTCELTRGLPVPFVVFLGLSVLDLSPMYATDRQTDVRHQTDAHHPLMPLPCRSGGGITRLYEFASSFAASTANVWLSMLLLVHLLIFFQKILTHGNSLLYANHSHNLWNVLFHRGTLCVSAVFGVARCLSVRPSVVCHVGVLYSDGWRYRQTFLLAR